MTTKKKGTPHQTKTRGATIDLRAVVSTRWGSHSSGEAKRSMTSGGESHKKRLVRPTLKPRGTGLFVLRGNDHKGRGGQPVGKVSKKTKPRSNYLPQRKQHQGGGGGVLKKKE